MRQPPVLALLAHDIPPQTHGLRRLRCPATTLKGALALRTTGKRGSEDERNSCLRPAKKRTVYGGSILPDRRSYTPVGDGRREGRREGSGTGHRRRAVSEGIDACKRGDLEALLAVCVDLTARRASRAREGSGPSPSGSVHLLTSPARRAASVLSPGAWGSIHERRLLKLNPLWVLQSSAEIESPSKGIATSATCSPGTMGTVTRVVSSGSPILYRPASCNLLIVGVMFA